MVKFVRTAYGVYFNVKAIEAFFIDTLMEGEEVKDYRVMFDLSREPGRQYRLKKGFETMEEAQAWLDNFIEELEF